MSKKLYKSHKKMICGVCAGIAEFFNIDPTIVRLIAVLLSLGGVGFGIVIYVIATVVMPFPPIES